MNRKGGGEAVRQSVAKSSSPVPSGNRISQTTASIGARGVRSLGGGLVERRHEHEGGGELEEADAGHTTQPSRNDRGSNKHQAPPTTYMAHISRLRQARR